jgi:hypothetical protein
LKRKIFEDTNKELPFVIHKHVVGNKTSYQLSVQTDNDELQYMEFPCQARETLSNKPNITKLFGRESEDTRSPEWLEFEGQTLNAEGEIAVDGQMKPVSGIYEIIDSGLLKIGKQTNEHSEIFLQGRTLTDRWILRRLPNVFDNSFLSDSEEVILLWKPQKQKSYNSSPEEPYNIVLCDCPIKDASSKFHEYAKEEGVEILSKLTTDILFDYNTQTFEGISAAEGTWVDMFGNKYTYTPEFIIHTYNKQRDMLNSGEKITLNTEHLGENYEGEVTDVKLYQQPIYHIKVKGIYKGPSKLSDDKFGLSYEYRLRSSWNEEFQTWIPFESITERLSVVKRPACKVCWITKVK